MLWVIIIVIYIGVGIGVMLWVQRDNEFREAPGIELYTFGSIVFWPVLGPLWYYTRPPEQVQDLAASKSFADFQRFMKERKKGDQDLLSGLDRRTTPDKPLEIRQETEYRDLHLEELINSGNYHEAMRTANDMLRFAREQEEGARVMAYTRYINMIMDRRREELG